MDIDTTGKSAHEIMLEQLLAEALEQLRNLNNKLVSGAAFSINTRSSDSSISSNIGSSSNLSPNATITPINLSHVPKSLNKPNKAASSRSSVKATNVATAAKTQLRSNKAQTANARSVPEPISSSSNSSSSGSSNSSSSSRDVSSSITDTNYEFTPWFLREFCRRYKGQVVTCRAVADSAVAVYPRAKVTESQLKAIADNYPNVIKLVKTDNYSDSVYVGNKVTIQPVTNPNRKRLSAIKIY